MKCLVTGSHGFIGSHLVQALEKRGDTIIRLERRCLLDPLLLDLVIKDNPPDIIYHLAAHGNMSTQKDEDTIFTANLFGTWNLLQATKNIPYKAFVNVSSSSVTLPHQTIYSATKLGAEALCKAFVDEYEKPIVTIRPASVYGPGEADFRFIPTVFRSCLTGEPMTLAPDAMHNWIYISDVIDQMLLIDKNLAYALKGTCISVGTRVQTTNREAVEMIEQITGKKANITELKQLRSFDTDDWRIESNWYKNTPLERGLRKYYGWYTKERKEASK